MVNKAAMFDPNRRYQSPGEMLSDLMSLADRSSSNGSNGSARGTSSLPSKKRTLMVVESSANAKKPCARISSNMDSAYWSRPDPQRPAGLFTDQNQPADCVIFSTSNLGNEALEAFNDFGEQPATKSVPAILLLGPKHQNWAKQAHTNDWRATVATPNQNETAAGPLRSNDAGRKRSLTRRKAGIRKAEC